MKLNIRKLASMAGIFVLALTGGAGTASGSDYYSGAYGKFFGSTYHFWDFPAYFGSDIAAGGQYCIDGDTGQCELPQSKKITIKFNAAACSGHTQSTINAIDAEIKDWRSKLNARGWKVTYVTSGNSFTHSVRCVDLPNPRLGSTGSTGCSQVDSDNNVRVCAGAEVKLDVNAVIYSTLPGCNPTTDLRMVLRHELYHSVGLGHNESPNTLMYPTFKSCTNYQPLSAEFQRLQDFRHEVNGIAD